MFQQVLVYVIGVVIAIYLLKKLIVKIRLLQKKEGRSLCSGCGLKDCCTKDKRQNHCDKNEKS